LDPPILEAAEITTGLNPLLLYIEQNFRDFSPAKVFFRTQIFKSENFMYIDWSEEKFLRGSVGHKIKL